MTCSPDFYLENSICFPICQEWTRFSYAEAALVRGSASTASVLGIMGGIAVIVGSIIRYKSMWVEMTCLIAYIKILRVVQWIAFKVFRILVQKIYSIYFSKGKSRNYIDVTNMAIQTQIWSVKQWCNCEHIFSPWCHCWTLSKLL